MRAKWFIPIMCILASCAPAVEEAIPHRTPEQAGMDSRKLERIDSVINTAIEGGVIPGAVVGIVKDGAIVFEKAYGYKAVLPALDTMTVDTMFDLASLTKCLGTTIGIMQLVEKGQVRLMDPVSHYIPNFKDWRDPKTKKRERIRIQHLLTHSSGLDPFLRDVPKYVELYGAGTPDTLVNYIATTSERHFKPGTDVLYSCLNFIMLQNILERVTGERLCDYLQKNVFDVLGLEHTCFFPLDGRPIKPELAPLCAPTEFVGDSLLLKAQVHDPTARIVMMGNSGNAGMFSNVEDIAVLCCTLLNGGQWQGKRILGSQTVRKMFEVPADNGPEVHRALGWDTYYAAPYMSGDIFEVQNLRGHSGYTGTSVLIDPDTSTALIILSHRVHPKDTGSVTRLRALIASITAGAIE